MNKLKLDSLKRQDNITFIPFRFIAYKIWDPYILLVSKYMYRLCGIQRIIESMLIRMQTEYMLNADVVVLTPRGQNEILHKNKSGEQLWAFQIQKPCL